jgi:RNA polymerase sigma factor (sigma-70 family)
METNDRNLLRQYVERHSQDAFAALVSRHVNLVYSVALRQVRSPQLAEEVSQSVFTDLARQAPRLTPDTILTAWLYQVARRTAIDVIRHESRRQLREQVAYELTAMNATAADWTHVEPLLDEAMQALDDTDRAAVLLRYFENKSLREVGATLGTSDDAAQKRVSRAVERLREFFAKRGVAVGAAGLAVTISANAVQAAPAGLAAAISSAAVLAGSTLTTTTTATITKVIAMTALQKTLITATIAVTVSAGIYQAHQASTLRAQVQSLQEQQSEQIQQLQSERDNAARQLAALRADNVRLNNNTAELQGIVARLSQSQPVSAPGGANATTNNFLADAMDRMLNDPEYRNDFRKIQVTVAKNRYASLFKELTLTPEEQETLIRLRVDQVILNQDKYMAFLKGGDATELQKEVDAALAKYDGERSALLGDDRFQQLKNYENTWSVRTTVDAFKGAIEDSNPLSGDQAQQLLEIMIQERAKSPPLENRDDAELTLNAFDVEAGQKRLQAQEQMNQQVLSRAAAFLSPPQMDALAKDQADNLASQKKDFRTSTRWFGGKTN